MVLGVISREGNWGMKIVRGLLLIGVILFCGFGFLSTFEPLDPAQQWGWRVFYAVAFLGATLRILRLFGGKVERR